MRTLFALLLLFTSAALAQGPANPQGNRLSRGNFLRIPAYQTAGTGAQNYFVDGTNGNDSNNCTASGTSACATIQGAVNRIPKLIRDGVVVSVAAGTYGCFYFTGFREDLGIQQSTGGVLFNGALANITPATGTATGTATGGTAGSGATFGTLVDGAQTWTVNDLRGHLVVITGGTGNGQVRVISSNTATTITVVGTWTAPNGTSTYVIQDPSVIINTACATPPTGINGALANVASIWFAGNNISYRTNAITVQNFKFTSASGIGVTVLDSSTYTFNQAVMSLPGGSGGISSGVQSNPRLTVTNVSYAGAGGAHFLAMGGGFFTMNNSLAFGGANGLFISTGGVTNGSINSSEANASAVAGIAAPYGHYTVSGTRFDCGGNASNYAVLVGTNSRNNTISTANPSPDGLASIGLSSVDIGTNGCGFGIGAFGNGTAWMNGVSGTAITNAYVASWSGQIFQNGANTATGGTTDWTVDNGKVTGALADVTSGNCVSTLSYGSRFCN